MNSVRGKHSPVPVGRPQESSALPPAHKPAPYAPQLSALQTERINGSAERKAAATFAPLNRTPNSSGPTAMKQFCYPPGHGPQSATQTSSTSPSAAQSLSLASRPLDPVSSMPLPAHTLTSSAGQSSITTTSLTVTTGSSPHPSTTDLHPYNSAPPSLQLGNGAAPDLDSSLDLHAQHHSGIMVPPPGVQPATDPVSPTSPLANDGFSSLSNSDDDQSFSFGGYDAKFDPELPEHLICPICKQGMKDPIRVPCSGGHRFCKLCFDSVMVDEELACPLHHENITEVYPDATYQYEIKHWKVQCNNWTIGCSWNDCLKDLEDHLGDCDFQMRPCVNARYGCKFRSQKFMMDVHVTGSCEFKPMTCSLCGVEMAQSAEKKHLLDCPGVETGCPSNCGAMLPRKALDAHLADGCPMSLASCVYQKYGCNVKTFKIKQEEHMRHDAHAHIGLLAKLIEQERAEKAALSSELASLKDTVKQLEERVNSSAFLQEDGMQQAVERACRAMMEKQMCSMQDSIVDLQTRVQVTEELVPKVKVRVDGLSRTVDKSQAAAKTMELDVSQTKGKVTSMEVETSTFAHLTENVLNQLDIRLLSQELTSYNGVYIWKIPGYSQQVENARAGKEVALISPPFYTSRHGYKMCARLYPDGDGMGKGSHISVFFVLMRGEFDALLKWPFQQKVTITLFDQSPSTKHISDTFIPDPASNSFERPRSEMNIATGCPRFVPVETVKMSRGYAMDDTMFLRIAVNTGGLINY